MTWAIVFTSGDGKNHECSGEMSYFFNVNGRYMDLW
jgi:hypothetical protein